MRADHRSTSFQNLPLGRVSLYLSHLPGIAGYRAIPPSPKCALSQPRGKGGRAYRSSSCPLEGIPLYGGIAEIVLPIAV